MKKKYSQRTDRSQKEKHKLLLAILKLFNFTNNKKNTGQCYTEISFLRIKLAKIQSPNFITHSGTSNRILHSHTLLARAQNGTALWGPNGNGDPNYNHIDFACSSSAPGICFISAPIPALSKVTQTPG